MQRFGMNVVQREIAIDEAYLVRIPLQNGIQIRFELAAVGTLEIGELDDGDFRVGRAAARSRRGDLDAQRFEL